MCVVFPLEARCTGGERLENERIEMMMTRSFRGNVVDGGCGRIFCCCFAVYPIPSRFVMVSSSSSAFHDACRHEREIRRNFRSVCGRRICPMAATGPRTFPVEYFSFPPWQFKKLPILLFLAEKKNMCDVW